MTADFVKRFLGMYAHLNLGMLVPTPITGDGMYSVRSCIGGNGVAPWHAKRKKGSAQNMKSKFTKRPEGCLSTKSKIGHLRIRARIEQQMNPC
jgi:hypothetical protein